jgi:thymidine kinase
MDKYVVKPSTFELFCGPMRSGKSEALIRRVDKIDFIMNRHYIFFKPRIDDRNEHYSVSRYTDKKFPCQLIDHDKPKKIIEYVEEEDEEVVCIDEIQFFEYGIQYVIEELLLKGKNVIAAGLDLNFRGEPFGPMPELLALADEVYKLTAVCEYEDCGGIATRTQRLFKDEPVHYNSDIILVGDEEYQPRCLKHHIVPGKKEAIEKKMRAPKIMYF